MPKDCNGREIKIGDVVKHKHEPDSVVGNECVGFHNFAGKARVVRLFTGCVEVERHSHSQIPVYCSELVEVVSP